MNTQRLIAVRNLLKLKWQPLIALISLISIMCYLILEILDSSKSNLPLLFTLVIGGIPLVLQILFKLLRGNLGADTLAAIALITSFILQEYLAGVIIILMLASGQTLEKYARRKASSVLLALANRMPSIAHRKINSQMYDVALADINIGDILIIYPHEICPVDGVVIEGHGTMDESYLTGEPYQISKAAGANVLSGAINGESVLTIRAIKLTSDSRYATIVKVLEEAEQKRPSIRRLGDRVGAIFAPLALLFASLAWYFTNDATRFLAVLVIATPCPLLIAIPITIISAISRAAKQSIIIKDPTVLEQLPTCKTAIFDKTGTLTYGKPTLTKILTTKNFTNAELLQCVASLERYSKHPLASAVINAANAQNIKLLEPSNVSEKPGHGLSGTVSHYKIQVTGRKKLLETYPRYATLLPAASPGLECIILLNDQYAGSLHFHDAPRAESKSFINHLNPSHQFTKLMLVSGDRESEVNYLAKLLHFNEVYASQSPEDKLAIVRRERLKAPTFFMGDGINDAPALTAATVGIAFGQNSNITAEAAGVVIMENTLYKVDELIHLSLMTRNIAAQSAIGGMILSIIGMGFAAAGFISPVAGAIIQECIDILAIINSLRLTFGSRIKTDLQSNVT